MEEDQRRERCRLLIIVLRGLMCKNNVSSVEDLKKSILKYDGLTSISRTGRWKGVVRELPNPSRTGFLGTSPWTDILSRNIVLSHSLPVNPIMWGSRSCNTAVWGVQVLFAPSSRDLALAETLSRDTVLTGGFGGTRGLLTPICSFWSVCSLRDSFQGPVLLIFLFSLSSVLWRGPVIFPLCCFILLVTKFARRIRGALLRCLPSSTSLSELIVLSELLAGALRLFAIGFGLDGVSVLSFLVAFLAYELTVALLLFSLLNSSLELPEFVRGGDWERDEDGEMDEPGWTTGTLPHAATRRTDLHEVLIKCMRKWNI